MNADKVQQKIDIKLRKTYTDALKTIVKQNKEFLKVVKDVQSGAKKPPQSYIDNGTVDKWKEGFLKQQMRQMAVISKISQALEEVGGNSKSIIKNSYPDLYTAQYYQTAGDIKANAAKSGLRVQFGGLNKKAVTTAVNDYQENAPFAKIALANLGTNTRARHLLQLEMAKSIALGESQSAFIKRIRTVVGGVYYNAQRIAQTEGTRIRSQARNETTQQAADMGIRIANEWSCAMLPPNAKGQGGSRDTHILMHGVCVMQGEDFVLPDGDHLAFPGDPRGKACNVINCHCTLIPHVLKKNEAIVDGKIVEVSAPDPVKLQSDKDGNIVNADTGEVVQTAAEAAANTTTNANGDIIDNQTGVVLVQSGANGWLNYNNQLQSDYNDLQNMIVKYKSDEDDLKNQLDIIKGQPISGIWKSKDVDASDFAQLEASGSYQGKLDFFNGKITDLLQKQNDGTITPYESMLLTQYQDSIAKLQDLKQNGETYEQLNTLYQDAVAKTAKARSDLQNVENELIARGVIQKQNPYADAYTKARKDAAHWWTGTKGNKNADDYLRDKCGEVWRNASKSQRLAAYDYTAGSGKFNRPLSGFQGGWGQYNFKGVGKVDLDYEGGGKQIRLLTQIIEKSTYDDDIWLNRGCGFDAMESFLSLKSGTMRYMSEADLQQFVGYSGRIPAFVSCGTSKGKGFGGQVKMNIYCPRGSEMIYCEPFSAYGRGGGKNWDGISKQSSFGYEDETLLQRGGSYTITKIYKNGGTTYIDLDLHPQDGYDKFDQ